jgi:hypothetical protein
MKGIKKHKLWAITLVIAGLLIAVSASSAMQLKTLEEQTPEPLKFEKSADLIKTMNQQNIAKKANFMPNGATFGNQPIMISDYDCQDPSIATDGTNILVIAEELQEIFESDILMVFSTDSGNEWSDIYTYPWEGTIEELPVVDYCGNSDFEAYGSCLPDSEEGRFHLLHFPSMTDPEKVWEDSEGWVEWGFEILGEYEEFKDIDIAGYPFGSGAPTPDFHGIILSSCIDAGTGLDTLSLVFETDDSGVQLLYMPEVNGTIGQVAIDIDLSGGFYYEAIEWKDEPEQIEDGVWFDCCWLEPGNSDWWQGDWYGFALEGAYNPDVAAESGNCYCVCEVGDELVCYYSNDNLQTIDSSSVTTSGKLPSVTAIGETVICTFFDDGDLYKTVSEDAGVNWDDPVIVNDEPGSSTERTHGADAKNQFVAWTDERNIPTEIYFDKTFTAGDPPEAPDINGPTNGDSGDPITFTFKAVDLDGDDVRFIINWGDGISDTTTYVSSGTDKTATHTWGPGGDYIIKARAEDANGLIGPESTFEITIPRNRARFSSFFDIFPNFFRLLNIIFG